jgi:hypothetical protein
MLDDQEQNTSPLGQKLPKTGPLHLGQLHNDAI